MKTQREIQNKITQTVFRKKPNVDSAMYYEGIINALEWVIEKRKTLW